MFTKKLSLPRRTFLRGLGATVGLPLLEAMVPAFTATAKTAANPTPRFGAVFVPNGAIVDQWIPKAAGTDFEMMPILKSLEPFRKSLVIVSNLTRANPGVVEGDHAISAAGFLTGVYPKRTEAEDVHAGTSIDQIVAAEVGQDTPFPSLDIATADFSGYIGACTSGFSCGYINTISWSTPTTPLPMEFNPRVVFERLFGRPGTPEQRAARQRRSLSILDLISQQANDLQPVSARATARGSPNTWTTSARSSAASSGRRRTTAARSRHSLFRSGFRNRSRSISGSCTTC